MGSDGLKSIVSDAGFSLDENNAAAVIVGVDRDISYNKIRIASKLIREGAEFIGTNPDKTFPTPRGLEPGAGSIIASVAAAAEKEPLYVGKPGKIMMDLALSRLNGITKEQVLQVGDRLDTDIAAGQNYGCLTAVVLSGVTTLAMAQQWRPEPDFIYNDLAEISWSMNNSSEKPLITDFNLNSLKRSCFQWENLNFEQNKYGKVSIIH